MSLAIELLANDRDNSSKSSIFGRCNVQLARLLIPASIMRCTAGRSRRRSIDADGDAKETETSTARSRVVDLLVEFFFCLSIELHLKAKLGNNDELDYACESLRLGWCILLECVAPVFNVPFRELADL
jgi:hypothetical protein